MPKLRVRLFHWNETEAAERADRLIKAGFDADFDYKVEPGFARRLAERAPQVLIIDLSRLPSHGREVAIHARRTKATRFTPIVFVGGDPEKVERIRALIPDAVFAGWSGIKSAIHCAVKSSPVISPRPDPYMKRWAASPLAKKLGLEPDTVVALIGAPEGFSEFVRAPEGVQFVDKLRPGVGLALVFATTVDELDLQLHSVLPRLDQRARIWVCWPKARSRQFSSDFTQYVVLETCRAQGLVTSKIVSIDNNWSAMKFSFPNLYRNH